MHTYIRLFFNLLVPLSLLFVVASIGYFTFNYDFSKAIKLGVLSGVLIGIAVSFVMAFALLKLRKVEKVENSELDDNNKIEEVSKGHSQPQDKQSKDISKEIKCMLLMESALAFEVLLNTLENQKICTVSDSDPQKGTLTIETNEGIVQTTITPLTEHTSQLIFLTQNNAKYIKQLISVIKEKERSFLQY